MPKITKLPKVHFCPSKAKNGVHYLYLQYRLNGRCFRKSTGEQIEPNLWDNKTQRVKRDSRKPSAHVLINNELDRLAAILPEIYREFNFGEISFDDFRNEIDYRMGYRARPKPEAPEQVPFLEFVDRYIQDIKQSTKFGTWKGLNTVANKLRQYAEERAPKLDYASIDQAFFIDFKKWLFAPPLLHSSNTASKTVNVVKRFLRDAQRRGYHTKTDFHGFTVKKERTTKIALSFDELEKLYRLDLSDNSRLERVRDLFLIGAYTGLRFSDFNRVRPEHFTTEKNGTIILTMTTQKTGQEVTIPISEIPESILRKYAFSPPNMSNQKLNDYLKELGKLASITNKIVVIESKGGRRTETVFEKWEKITSHVARRSFATNYFLKGLPIAMLMKITGHTTQAQFMGYIAIDGKENALRMAEMLANEKHDTKP